MRLRANKRFVRTEAADKNADHSNYVSARPVFIQWAHANVDDVLGRPVRILPSLVQLLCTRTRFYYTKDKFDDPPPPSPLNCPFCKNNPLRFFFKNFFFVIIFFSFLLRPLALLFKSAIAISFYLIIDVRTPHVFRIFPRTKIQYFIIIKKEDLTYAFGWKRKGSRGNITPRVVWIKLWRHDEKGCNIFGNRRSVVRHNSTNKIIF